MGAILDYFRSIGRTVLTLGDGLAVTGSYFLRKPATLQYPDRTDKPIVATLPERSRGLLEVDMDLCTGCALCEKTCPIACIKIEMSKGKDRQITRFDIDMGKCMHCGLCAECCPTEGIRHTREFEGGMVNPDLLYMHFVDTPLAPAKPAKKGEPEPDKKPLGSVLRHLLPDTFGLRRPKPTWKPRPPPAPAAPKPEAGAATPAAEAPKTEAAPKADAPKPEAAPKAEAVAAPLDTKLVPTGEPS